MQTGERLVSMNRLMVLILGLCVVPAWACGAADDPAPEAPSAATQPATESEAHATDGQPQPETAGRDAAARQAAGEDVAADMAPPPSRFFRRPGRGGDRPIDWDAVQKFAVQHTPRRWSLFDSSESGVNHSMRAKQFVAESFQKLLDLKEKDPDIYDCRVAQIECEDEIYGICGDARGGKLAKDQAASQLRKAVNRLVDARLKERTVRVKKASAALENAQQKLQRDQKQREKLVDRQVNAIIENDFVPVPPRHNRGHDQSESDD
jgi:hypothetical protein